MFKKCNSPRNILKENNVINEFVYCKMYVLFLFRQKRGSRNSNFFMLRKISLNMRVLAFQFLPKQPNVNCMAITAAGKFIPALIKEL